MPKFKVDDIVEVIGAGVNWSLSYTRGRGYVENNTYKIVDIVPEEKVVTNYGIKYRGVVIYSVSLPVDINYAAKFPEASLQLYFPNSVSDYSIE